jgi:signal transduction histidine kinase
MASAALTRAPDRPLIRDPVFIAPAVVAAGLAVGWLGVQEDVAGTRVAADLALAWSLAWAFVVVAERQRWRRSAWPLGLAAFAVLGADLEWSRSGLLWTVGFVLEGLWVALLVLFVLGFAEQRPRPRPVMLACAAALVVTFGGQLAGLLFARDTRDPIAVGSWESAAHAVDRAQEIAGTGVALIVLVVVLRRLAAVARPVRPLQTPLMAAAAVTVLVGLVWLGWVVASGAGAATPETVARATAVLIPLGVCAGTVWSRMRQPQASDLVVELRGDTAGTLRERLARALGDPTLEVAYRLEDGGYVDAGGGPFELPETGERAATPVTAGGETVAVLIHDPALLDDSALVESVRATAGLVVENERLAAEVRAQLAAVRASRARLVAASDAERRRIERDLHDGAQQRLVTLSVSLGLEASRADPAEAEALRRAQAEVEQAIAELRDLARGIHPTLLRDSGLQAAVEALARRAPLPVAVRGHVAVRPPEPVELAAYFVIAEALTNVVKHASATEAAVVLEQQPQALRITVADDGVGGAEIRPGAGLAGLRDRLEALDATLSVESRRGSGTSITTEFRFAS